MAELADAPDLGSGVPDVKVQVLFGAPKTTRWDTRLVVFLLSISLNFNSLCELHFCEHKLYFCTNIAQKGFLSPFWCTKQNKPEPFGSGLFLYILIIYYRYPLCHNHKRRHKPMPNSCRGDCVFLRMQESI